MFQILQYAGIIVALAIYLLGLKKDWSSTSPKTRVTLATLIIMGGCVSLVSMYESRKQSQKERAELIAAQRSTLNTLSAQNDVLLDKVIELESKVMTEELRAELSQTRNELEEMHEALSAEPKAKFILSLLAEGEMIFDLDNTRTEISLPLSNGVVTPRFAIFNASNVYASGVKIWVQICDSCEFAEEPLHFTKIADSDYVPNMRIWNLGKSPDSTRAPVIELKIKPPPLGSPIAVTIEVRCLECGPATRRKFWIDIEDRKSTLKSR